MLNFKPIGAPSITICFSSLRLPLLVAVIFDADDMEALSRPRRGDREAENDEDMEMESEDDAEEEEDEDDEEVDDQGDIVEDLELSDDDEIMSRFGCQQDQLL